MAAWTDKRLWFSAVKWIVALTFVAATGVAALADARFRVLPLAASIASVDMTLIPQARKTFWRLPGNALIDRSMIVLDARNRERYSFCNAGTEESGNA